MKNKNVCIIGMGYVGLTLALVSAKRGFNVCGIEREPKILESLGNGKPHFYEKGLASLLAEVRGGRIYFSSSIPADTQFDIFIIAVGTPLDRERQKPVLDFLRAAVKDIAAHMREDALVILRSTVPVGTTRNMASTLLTLKGPGRFFLAYCPERTVEGKALEELTYLPQVIGGIDEESVSRATDFFREITDTVVPLSSLEAAEAAKLLDNSYRDLRFAFANEIALFAKSMGLNAAEVIRAVNFKYPRNDIPSPGFAGGPCLEKDPYILLDSVKAVSGYAPELIRVARQVNEKLPGEAARRVKAYLADASKDIAVAKIFICGFAFKGRPETDDIRGSPAAELVRILKENGANNVYGHDFVVSPEAIGRLGVKPCDLEDGFRSADCLVLMNNHKGYETLKFDSCFKLMNNSAFVFDGWHLFDPVGLKRYPHIKYEGLGSK